MRLRIAILAVTAPLVLWVVLPLASSGQSGRAAQIEKKITRTQRKIETKKKTEKVLTTTIAGYTTRINSIQDDIGRLQQRQDVIQADLDAKKAELARLQEELRKQRARLARLKARLAASRAILADRLRATYEADKPDIVTVILSAKGFADLVERGEFLDRVNTQDREILLRVKADKERTTRVAKHLDKLENRQQKVTTAILVRRNEVAQVKGRLVDKQDSWAAVRSDKSAALDTVRAERKQLDGTLADLQDEQAKISGVLNSGGGSGSARRAGHRARAAWCGRSTGRSRPRSASRGRGSPATPASTSPTLRARRSTPPTPAPSRSPAGPAATATTPASSTPPRCPPATATSRRSTSAPGRASARARSSDWSAAPGTRRARTSTSRCASTAPS